MLCRGMKFGEARRLRSQNAIHFNAARITLPPTGEKRMEESKKKDERESCVG